MLEPKQGNPPKKIGRDRKTVLSANIDNGVLGGIENIFLIFSFPDYSSQAWTPISDHVPIKFLRCYTPCCYLSGYLFLGRWLITCNTRVQIKDTSIIFIFQSQMSDQQQPPQAFML